MINQMWSVSDVVRYIKRGIDHDENLMSLLVQGEVSNLTKHRSGHYYFTLKDENARMSCVMFANYARLVHFDLKEGSHVIANCKVSVYEASGSVQLYVNGLQLEGIGDLYLQFEKLKKKLREQGYFEEVHKKAIPTYPSSIGVISAAKAAALSDVMTTLKRRWPLANVTFYESLVQGNEASAQLIKTIQKADQNQHDVILLVRGGGSIEDLWAFNSEQLAITIYKANTPIITGVGHETDTTLVDFVSDLRAATPTAAAQQATPDLIEVHALLTQLKNRLNERMKSKIETSEAQLHRLTHHPYLKNPQSYVENNIIYLDMKRQEFDYQMHQLLNLYNEIKVKKQQLHHFEQTQIVKVKNELDMKCDRLKEKMNDVIENEDMELRRKIALLDAFSPLKVLLRGYSMTKIENKIVRSLDDVKIDDEIRTYLKDGEVISHVIRKENHDG